MSKLKLSLDEIIVESFVANEKEFNSRGTVKGETGPGATCVNMVTCEPACVYTVDMPNTCGTCDIHCPDPSSYHQPCPTGDVTCQVTCMFSDLRRCTEDASCMQTCYGEQCNFWETRWQ